MHITGETANRKTVQGLSEVRSPRGYGKRATARFSVHGVREFFFIQFCYSGPSRGCVMDVLCERRGGRSFVKSFVRITKHMSNFGHIVLHGPELQIFCGKVKVLVSGHAPRRGHSYCSDL